MFTVIYTGSSDIGDTQLPNITFPVGSETGYIQCTTVTIVGDDIVENNERFDLRFMALNELDSFGASNTEVTIVDDDG